MRHISLAVAVLLALAGARGVPAGEGASGKGGDAKPLPRLSPKGRFLYANDDDWDWASPKGRQTTRLSSYGVMEWSALDLMEEDLKEVRGLVIGTLPYVSDLPGHDVDAARGRKGKKTYRREAHRAGLLARRLSSSARDAPNVVLLMRNLSSDPMPAFTPADLEALAAFVRRGGRLIVIDDWGAYRPVLERMLSDRSAGKVAGPPAPKKSFRDKVLALVRLLGDDDWKTRERATEDLIALGGKVVPIINGIKSKDAEVRERLRRVIAALSGGGAAGGGASRSLSNSAMEALLAKARKVHKSSKMLHIKRGGAEGVGRALLIELPVPARKGSGEKTVPGAAKRDF